MIVFCHITCNQCILLWVCYEVKLCESGPLCSLHSKNVILPSENFDLKIK